jgi:DNA (cytosine-5)-methyltransferase 1
MIEGDLTDKDIFNNLIDKTLRNKCNLLLATPPCQGMSIAGKMTKGDLRNNLIKYVVNFIKKTDIDYILIENVPTMPDFFILDNNEDIKIRDYLFNNLQDNYNIFIEILNCADFGVPQNRKRCFVFISKKNILQFKIPTKQKHITVRDAISHLPSLESGEDSGIPFHRAKIHNQNHILWLKNTPTGKTALDNKIYYPIKDGRKIKGYKTTYKRMDWSKPAPTITMANGSISSQNNVHPGNIKSDGTYDNARVLTLKELFILMGLPKNYMPPDFATESFVRKVLGEGIPPLIIKKIFYSLLYGS